MSRSAIRHPRSAALWLAAALALACAAAPAPAQVRSSTSYAITADGVDSGGGTSSSASYTQRISFGQAFATPPMVGVSYNNQGGLVATTSPDTQAPTVPTGLTAGAVTTSQVCFSWSPASDIVGVTRYLIYRNGTLLATLTGNPPPTSYCDNTVAPSTTYTYTVQACDAASNCSAQSAPFSATTPALPDTTPPTVPTGLTATAVSNSQVDLAWNASSDNVGVTAYQVFRDGAFRATVTGSANFSDTGLAGSTPYSYTVAACDGAGNCSGQSAAASATTQAGFTPSLAANWNLMGNALNITLDVTTVFGGNANIASVWKWDAATQNWAYYSPALTSEQLIAFTTSRAYQVLASIGPGEGYWVNALNAITLPAQTGAGFSYNLTSFAALPSSWNLIAMATEMSPHAFSNAMTDSPPPTSGVNDSFFSLWAWDAVRQNWYYYSPALENTGSPKCGLPCVKSYTDARGLLHFEDYGKTLGLGVGFWVNRR